MDNKTLYYPEYFKDSWLDNLVLFSDLDVCAVHSDDGATSEAMGCVGLNCRNCIFYGKNVKSDISNVTLKQWFPDHE